jgi:hypothetical protein
MTTPTTLPPLEFIDKMHDWMCELQAHPLSPHGHKELAQRAWKYFEESKYHVKN